MIRALVFVLDSLVNLFVLAVLLRFYAQAFHAPFRTNAGNPLADFIVALTDWAILPMRRLVPGMWKLDLASLVVAWLMLLALALAVFMLLGQASMNRAVFWPALMLYAMVDLCKLSLYLLFGVLVVQALLSWLNPFHPMQPFFNTLSRPFLRPVQRIVPLIGGVDLSPLLVMLLIQVLLMGPVAFLSAEVLRMIGRAAL